MRIISQDHSKLDSDTIVNAIRLLVEADLSLKIRVMIADVQLNFNYTISYCKAWLEKCVQPSSHGIGKGKLLSLNELFTRKSVEAQERINARHSFSEFVTSKL
ncbi:hypothetical protein AHAS_Ahas11G0152000 [Arachis hypogaea]